MRNLFCSVDLILYVRSTRVSQYIEKEKETIFQLCRDGSSWVEQVIIWDKCVLLKDHKAVKSVRLDPVAPWSQVNHSTIALPSTCGMKLRKLLKLEQPFGNIENSNFREF